MGAIKDDPLRAEWTVNALSKNTGALLLIGNPAKARGANAVFSDVFGAREADDVAEYLLRLLHGFFAGGAIDALVVLRF